MLGNKQLGSYWRLNAIMPIFPALIANSGRNKPGAPTSPTLTAINSSSLQASWTAPQELGKHSLTNYVISLYNASATLINANYTTVAHPSTSVVVSGLSASTQYAIRVSLQNSANIISDLSASSANVSTTVPAPVFSDATIGTPTTRGQAYSDGVLANNTTSYSVFSGSLPAGLVLNTSTGTITGTPTTSGTSTFVIRATGPGGTTNTGSLTIQVVAPPPPPPPPPNQNVCGTACGNCIDNGGQWIFTSSSGSDGYCQYPPPPPPVTCSYAGNVGASFFDCPSGQAALYTCTDGSSYTQCI
jgi:hypothetical protein